MRPFSGIGNANFDSHRHCWEFLRAFHSKRRLHARLQFVCALGLHGIEQKEGKRIGAWTHEKFLKADTRSSSGIALLATRKAN
jgi:hypothetical protein